MVCFTPNVKRALKFNAFVYSFDKILFLIISFQLMRFTTNAIKWAGEYNAHQ